MRWTLYHPFLRIWLDAKHPRRVVTLMRRQSIQMRWLLIPIAARVLGRPEQLRRVFDVLIHVT
jgi:hypothetical protein